MRHKKWEKNRNNSSEKKALLWGIGSHLAEECPRRNELRDYKQSISKAHVIFNKWYYKTHRH